MSILIRGMEMPTKQTTVTIFPNGYAAIYDAQDSFIGETKAVSITPHGRLIDADALIIALETQDYSCAPDTLDDWTPMDMTKAEIADIKAAPTIIEEEEET